MNIHLHKILICVPLIFSTFILSAQSLVPQDGMAGDRFGEDVAASGSWIAIGAQYQDEKATDAGAVYMYQYANQSWAMIQKLMASDGTHTDVFGNAISMDGNQMVIGASFDSVLANGSGSVYIFKHDGTQWVEDQKLSPSDGEEGDQYGIAVGISEDFLAVGTPLEDEKGENAGAAYLYHLANDAYVEQKVVAGDGDADDRFGEAIAVSNVRAIIGAPGDEDNGLSAGAVYFYQFDGNTWQFIEQLYASDAAGGARFGHAVDIEGTRAVVGANLVGSNEGAVYVFEFDGSKWVETARIQPSDKKISQEFGHSVSLSGDSMLIGAVGDSDKGTFSGAAYLFVYDGSSWQEMEKYTFSDQQNLDFVGKSVGLSKEGIAIGANGADNLGNNSGRGYALGMPQANSLMPDLELDQFSFLQQTGSIQMTILHANALKGSLLNLAGQTLWEGDYHLKGSAQTFHISTDMLSDGVYFVRWEDQQQQFIHKWIYRH